MNIRRVLSSLMCAFGVLMAAAPAVAADKVS